jgi:membrane-associated phospholipid phosphatase
MARYHIPRPMQWTGSPLRTTIEKSLSLIARSLWLGLTIFLLPGVVSAGGGFLGIDSELPLDTGGIWARKYQTGIENGVIAVEVAGALWFGNDDKLGHAFWQDIDSTALSGVAAELLKYGFSRPRPYQGDNPNAWFKGSCCQSFPSGEVTLQAAFVTPLIVNYYKQEPWIWALEALPVYDAIARLKSQAHWQTDVIAGGLVGTGFGYWATTRNTPLSVQILPRGLTIGISKRF